MYPKIISETDGDVLGAASSTDNAIVRFDGTTGDVIQNGLATESDTGEITFQTSTDSYSAFRQLNSSYGTMARIDTRTMSTLPAGSSKYIMGALGSTPGSGSTLFGLYGGVALTSGAQSYPIIGINGEFVAYGAASGSSTFRGLQFVVSWSATGAQTGTLVGSEINVLVGSSSVSAGAVTGAMGYRSAIGFYPGSLATSIGTVKLFYLQSPYSTDATHTIATFSGFKGEDCKKTGVTNAYVFDIDDQSAGGYVFKTNNGLHSFGGALLTKRTATATDYLTTINDNIIGVTSTAAARTITLSSAAFAQGTATRAYHVIVKDESGGAATNNITVATEGAELIDGAATYVIAQNYGSATFYSTGSAWNVI